MKAFLCLVSVLVFPLLGISGPTSKPKITQCKSSSVSLQDLQKQKYENLSKEYNRSLYQIESLDTGLKAFVFRGETLDLKQVLSRTSSEISDYVLLAQIGQFHRLGFGAEKSLELLAKANLYLVPALKRNFKALRFLEEGRRSKESYYINAFFPLISNALLSKGRGLSYIKQFRDVLNSIMDLQISYLDLTDIIMSMPNYAYSHLDAWIRFRSFDQERKLNLDQESFLNFLKKYEQEKLENEVERADLWLTEIDPKELMEVVIEDVLQIPHLKNPSGLSSSEIAFQLSKMLQPTHGNEASISNLFKLLASYKVNPDVDQLLELTEVFYLHNTKALKKRLPQYQSLLLGFANAEVDVLRNTKKPEFFEVLDVLEKKTDLSVFEFGMYLSIMPKFYSGDWRSWLESRDDFINTKRSQEEVNAYIQIMSPESKIPTSEKIKFFREYLGQ